MTSHFSVELVTGNDAFGHLPQEEIARILRDIADRLTEGFAGRHVFNGTCRDIYGNSVGRFSLS